MKKENKALAQKRKAEQRKKAKTKKIISVVCKIGIPSLLLVGLVVFCITITESKTESYTIDTSYQIQEGDILNIDYVGKIDGVAFEGGTAQGTKLEIGSDTFIEGFEDQLIGAHPGETVDVNVTFPEDYHAEEYAGKDATFEVTINGVYE